MRNFGAQYLYVQFLTNKHYSGCFTFTVSVWEKEQNNNRTEFQRKMTEFDTRS